MGIALGAGIGSALGVVMGNIAIGVAIGTGIGITLGVAFEGDAKKRGNVLARTEGERRENRHFKKGVFIGSLMFLLILIAAYFVFYGKKPASEEPIFCTADAKQCPDGSFVGRVAPTCEFAPCPRK